MKDAITVKSRFRIRNKIVEMDDIRQIANIFYKICSEYIDATYVKDEDRKEKYRDIHLRIRTADGREYSAHTFSILDKGSILDTKVVEDITLTFSDYRQHVDISIWLRAAREGSIEVQGDDATWVEGAGNRLVECTDSWANQNAIVKRYRWIFSTVLGLGVGWAILAIILGIASFFSNDPDVSAFSLQTLWGLLWGLALVYPIEEFIIERLWPDVELVPGPPHQRRLQQYRRMLFLFAIWVILPFIIGVINKYAF